MNKKIDILQFDQILNNIPADIIVTDVNHIYRYLNKHAIKDDELRKWIIGKDDFDFFKYRNKDLTIAKQRRKYFNQVIKNKKAVKWEEEFTLSNKSKSYILRILYPIIKNKKIDYIIGYGIDITDQVNERRKALGNEVLLNSIAKSTNELLVNKNLNNALTKALKYLGKATDVDRVYIFESHTGENGEKLISQKYEWAKEHISLQINNPDLQNIPFEAFGDLFNDLTNGGELNSIVKNIEPNLRSALEAQEIISILIVPIIIENKLWGFIGFDDCKNERIWSKTESNLLKAVAATIGHTIINNQTQQQLIKTNESFQAIFEAFPDLFFRLNNKGVIIDYKSSNTSKDLYVSPEYFLGKNVFNIMPPEISNKIQIFIKKSLRNKTISSFEYKLLNNENKLEDYECRILPQKQEVVAIIRNITQLKDAENKANYRKEILEEINNSLSEYLFWSLDVNSNQYLYISNSSVDIYGYKIEEIQNDTSLWIKTVHPKDKLKVERMYIKLLKGEKTKIEYRIIAKNGDVKHIESFVKPYKNSVGKIYRFDGIIRDITQQKKKEIELIKAKDIAYNAALLKQKMVSTISHEIRTPINAILGFSELLEKTNINATQIEYVENIKRASEQLQKLVNDVLNYQRLESGNTTLNENIFNLNNEIHFIEKQFSHKTSDRLKLIVTNNCKNNLFIGDNIKLNQILQNLVGNAFKYTERGYINISINEIHEGNKSSILIDVIDTGIGISKSNIKLLFKEFYQIKNQQNIAHSGSGLGMPITKKLVEMMGGKIKVKSSESLGTKFTVIIPFKIAIDNNKKDDEITFEKINFEKFDKKNILLVEDNQLNHFLIKKQIEKYGAKVISAFDGEDALVKFNEEKIDLIILDMLMPKLNGDEVVAKLNTIYNHLPPIIIFTANVLELNKLNSINHLITKIITKPISERELINEINMVI